MLHMVSEHGFNTRIEQAQHTTALENNKLTHFYFVLKFSYTQQREVHIYFAGNMADAGMCAKEECLPEQPINNEEGNIRDGESWVYINEIQDNKSELKRTVDELRFELRKVMEYNEQILKA